MRPSKLSKRRQFEGIRRVLEPHAIVHEFTHAPPAQAWRWLGLPASYLYGPPARSEQLRLRSGAPAPTFRPPART